MTATPVEKTTGGAAWEGFGGGPWRDAIDVRDFVRQNHVPYEGDGSFLAGPTEPTTAVWRKLLDMFPDERNRGIYDVDTHSPSRIDAFAPGYVDEERDLIVGLQTDAPLKRAIMPNGGWRMVESALAAYGYEADPAVKEIYTRLRKTHNDGVFDAYTPEIRACRPPASSPACRTPTAGAASSVTTAGSRSTAWTGSSRTSRPPRTSPSCMPAWTSCRLQAGPPGRRSVHGHHPPPPQGQPALSADAQRDTLFGVLGAGFETTVNLITSAFFHVLRNPASLCALRTGRVTYDDIVEETLRLRGPLAQLPFRYAVNDIPLHTATVIKKGDVISFMYAAAGRDPALHDDPDEFRPLRKEKRHVAFGHGVHHCPGASLGRLETRTALKTVLTALPDITLAHPDHTPALIHSPVMNGYQVLSVIPHPAPSRR